MTQHKVAQCNCLNPKVRLQYDGAISWVSCFNCGKGGLLLVKKDLVSAIKEWNDNNPSDVLIDLIEA